MMSNKYLQERKRNLRKEEVRRLWKVLCKESRYGAGI